MPRVFISVVDQTQTVRLAWREYSPAAVISGMTLAEFEAATAEPLDLLTKTHDKGRLGFGTIGSSAVLFGILAVLVAQSNSKSRAAELSAG